MSLALAAPASAQFTPGARSGGDPYFPNIGNGGIDAQHYDVTINYNPAANTFVAKVDIKIRATQALSEFSLDLRGFPGATATIDGEPATVSQSVADKLIITPAAGIVNNREFHLVIDYAGTPQQIQDPDTSFEGWARMSTGGVGTGAFVVNEPIGTIGWLPANNIPYDKATFDFHITAPTTHTALGNGELASRVDNGDGTTTWNWNMGYPMSTYLSTSTVGLFDYFELAGATATGKSGNPLLIYNAYESALSAAQKNTAATNAARQDGIVTFIADEVGTRYPFESHGVVLHRVPALGYALEVQTKSHFAGATISLATLAHEVAHQWFGNSVGPASWREIWFNEGWATWWAWYWANKQNNDPQTIEQRFNTVYATAAAQWNNPPAALAQGAVQLFSTFPVYNRPAGMLEGYRQIVGHSAFMAFAKALATDYAYSAITTPQFIALAKQVAQEKAGFESSNLNKLQIYFDQWLFGVGRPTMNPTTFFQSTSVTGSVGGTVAATLSLSLGAPATFGFFQAGVANDYLASTSANVISTAGDGLLTVADPSSTATGHLVNGTFSLPQALQAKASSGGGTGGAFAPVGGSASPTTLLTYTGPVSNDGITVDFKQPIGLTDPLRTGSYGKTLTFTLSTTNP